MLETFPIVPAHSRSLWILVAFMVVLFAGIGGMLLATARGAYASRFEVSDAGLRLRGDLYGRFIPAASIRGDAVRVVDLGLAPDLTPRRRTFGTAVGGYQSGWFRLGNGEKALIYLTDRSRVVYVPTTAGYSVLMSAHSPERLAERLRTIASR
jgi:hypothetical protein